MWIMARPVIAGERTSIRLRLVQILGRLMQINVVFVQSIDYSPVSTWVRARSGRVADPAASIQETNFERMQP